MPEVSSFLGYTGVLPVNHILDDASDELSPILFNCALEKVVREWDKTSSGGIRLGSVNKGIEMKCLAFADDMALLAETWEEAKEQSNELLKQAEKIGLNLLLLAACVLSTTAQHYDSEREDHYDVTDEDTDQPDSSRKAVDYSQYYSQPTTLVGNTQPAANIESSGFVSPIDFSALLATAQLGEGGSAVAASSARLQDFFRTANSEQAPFALPLTSGAFQVEQLTQSATQNNGTGFTSPEVKFQSLFDASGSASEVGFRPQDFLAPAKANVESEAQQSSHSPGFEFSSPSFAKLHKDYNTDPAPSYAEAIARAATEKPQADIRPVKSSYQASPNTDEGRAPVGLQPSKANYYSPASTEINQGKSVNQGYQSKVPVDIYGDKTSSYRAAPSDPHSGKSSYPGTGPVTFNGKYATKQVAASAPKISPEYFALSGNQGSSQYTRTPAVAPVPTKDVYRTQYRPLPSEEDARVASPQQSDDKESANGPKGKKCKKVEKNISADDIVKGRFKRQAMTCYVCEDPKTGGNYEECSYTTEPKSKKYFVGHATSYSTDKGTKPTTTYRYKRYLGDDPFGDEYDSYYSADSSSGYPYLFGASNDKENYRFTPEDFESAGTEYDPEKYASAAATTAGKHCKKVQKDSMTCFHCTDPKTGGSYEQCSYESQPKANNYFVARESSYNSKDKPSGSGSGSGYSERSKYAPTADPNIPKALEFAESAQKQVLAKTGGQGLDPYLYGSPEPYDPKEDKKASASDKVDSFYAPYKSYEEYFHHLFPELDAAGSKGSASSDVESYASGSGGQYSPSEKSEAKAQPGYDYKASLPEYFTDNEKKKDLDAVLGEFTQKDRSNCKKVTKDKMTCYQCIDKKGMQHEECMFVAASEPKSQHLAYHEMKEFRLVPKVNEKHPAASSNIPAVAPAKDSTVSSSDEKSQTLKDGSDDIGTSDVTTGKNKRKTFFKKVTTTTTTSAPVTRRKVEKSKKPVKAKEVVDLEPVVAASSTNEQRVEKQQEENPPPELSEQDRSPDGLYSAETKTRFDPVLKITLPEYMLSRSEHEAIFDEVMASGR
ncbi:uncharacterized protein [Anabrus simplex]|uniref:uncharacterized protein n=1 Tax=Anabrus simplex TaxID=316456 RepID=UPI0035A364A2